VAVGNGNTPDGRFRRGQLVIWDQGKGNAYFATILSRRQWLLGVDGWFVGYKVASGWMVPRRLNYHLAAPAKELRLSDGVQQPAANDRWWRTVAGRRHG
jgi:hypothetical protein